MNLNELARNPVFLGVSIFWFLDSYVSNSNSRGVHFSLISIAITISLEVDLRKSLPSRVNVSVETWGRTHADLVLLLPGLVKSNFDAVAHGLSLALNQEWVMIDELLVVSPNSIYKKDIRKRIVSMQSEVWIEFCKKLLFMGRWFPRYGNEFDNQIMMGLNYD